MKVQFIGAMHAKGTGKSGKDYDFCVLRYAVAIQGVMQSNRQVHGYGGEVQELSLDPSVIGDFSGIPIGQVVDVAVEPDPRNIQRNICVGVVKNSAPVPVSGGGAK